MIRIANPDDFPGIREVVAAAFGQPDEADLIEKLRADGDVWVEMVADEAGDITGHILFSRLGIGPIEGAALAPLAVAPARQRRGLGAALTRAGIERCRELGIAAVIVLGHADYYPRFGFSAALAAPLEAPFSGPSFMALELVPGALMAGGRVRYAPAFGI
jgi:putative acetyltransferase